MAKETQERLLKERILDTATARFFSKGYERTSIGEIIEALGVSKGAFYHYFPSKEALIEGIAERLGDEVIVELRGIAEDPALSGARKFEMIFRRAAVKKAERKEEVVALMALLRDDANAVLWKKLNAHSVGLVRPLLASAIEQGMAEGSFLQGDAAELADFILRMGLHLFDDVAELVRDDERRGLEAFTRRLELYGEAVSRMLGAAEGSLKLVGDEARTLLGSGR